MKKRDLFKNIVGIRTAKNNAIISGTGFFVHTEEKKIYLVTASHVARDTTLSTDIWLENLVTKLPFFIKLGSLSKMAIWLYHPSADLAILEVTETEQFDLTNYTLSLNQFADDFSNIPERETTLTMYGIPDLYSNLPFAPFTCDCKPASDLHVAYYEVTGTQFNCFMLDKPSTQGFSGGPVFSLEKGQELCFGIVHGTRGDNTGGKLAIVVHSAYLFELIGFAGK